MPRVSSTGALVTYMRPEAFGGEGADPDVVNLSLRLFAILDIGISVVAPGGATTLAPNRQALASLDALEGILRTMWRAGDLPGDHRKAIWQGLVDELAKFDIHTDPETLQALPFELALTRDVLDLVG